MYGTRPTVYRRPVRIPLHAERVASETVGMTQSHCPTAVSESVRPRTSHQDLFAFPIQDAGGGGATNRRRPILKTNWHATVIRQSHGGIQGWPSGHEPEHEPPE